MNESNESLALDEPREVLREIGMIARCLDSISNVEFQHLNLSRGNICICTASARIPASFRTSWLN